MLEILNIGSGGGHRFLNELGSVTAIDLSLKSLLNARNIYDYCYQADAREIPFPDESFDLVFSSHLLGHISLEDKQSVIKEIYHVTKRGGYSLHSAECESNNFIYARAKKYPDLFVKYFQDVYGHYGIEYPSACKLRFRDVGFQPIYENSDYCKGVIRPVCSGPINLDTN
jgi:ubiquinone/menaquinone biosynthesis C-methylase UbiE